MEARKAYRLEYYRRNAAAIKARSKAWYYAHPEQAAASRKAYHAKHQTSRCSTERKRYYTKRDSILFSKYGLREGDFARLLAEQNGGCAICGKPDLLGVDHCHKTLKIRGILCRRCNGGIGLLQDDPALIVKAAQYLQREYEYVPDPN